MLSIRKVKQIITRAKRIQATNKGWVVIVLDQLVN